MTRKATWHRAAETAAGPGVSSAEEVALTRYPPSSGASAYAPLEQNSPDPYDTYMSYVDSGLEAVQGGTPLSRSGSEDNPSRSEGDRPRSFDDSASHEDYVQYRQLSLHSYNNQQHSQHRLHNRGCRDDLNSWAQSHRHGNSRDSLAWEDRRRSSPGGTMASPVETRDVNMATPFDWLPFLVKQPENPTEPWVTAETQFNEQAMMFSGSFLSLKFQWQY